MGVLGVAGVHDTSRYPYLCGRNQRSGCPSPPENAGEGGEGDEGHLRVTIPVVHR
jgi:hypothetical protein